MMMAFFTLVVILHENGSEVVTLVLGQGCVAFKAPRRVEKDHVTLPASPPKCAAQAACIAATGVVLLLL